MCATSIKRGKTRQRGLAFLLIGWKTAMNIWANKNAATKQQPHNELTRFNCNFLFHNALNWIVIVGEEIEKRTTSSIGAARQKIGKEISELNEKLKVCKEAIQQMKAEIAKLEQQDQEPKDIASLIPNVVPWVRSFGPW